MKTFAKILSLVLLVITTFAAAPITKAASHSDDERTLQMRFLGRDYVTAGSALTAELTSTFDATAELTVENSTGKRFVETQFEVNEGFNLVKFNVAEIPAGIYFVKVKSDGKVQHLSFVVR
ncbi:MAG: T9SS type A sorting domain-containing protein [Bacteroidetes bacterium]|nr:T9SS type A sorting domain-containing protein [Bacteroidota bacterium]